MSSFIIIKIKLFIKKKSIYESSIHSKICIFFFIYIEVCKNLTLFKMIDIWVLVYSPIFIFNIIIFI